MNIDCYLLSTGNKDIEQTVSGLKATGQVAQINLIGPKVPANLGNGYGVLETEAPFSSQVMQTIAQSAHCQTICNVYPSGIL